MIWPNVKVRAIQTAAVDGSFGQVEMTCVETATVVQRN